MLKPIAILFIAALACSCTELPDYTKKGKLSGDIVMIKKEEARKDGSLYILPQNCYAILRNDDNHEETLETASAPLLIKEKEISQWTVRYCIDKIGDYFPLKRTVAICSYSNKTLIESVLSNMEKPAALEFRESPGSDIEFYFLK